MNGEIKYTMSVYIHSEGMSLQFTNERMQNISTAYLQGENPNKARLLTVFKEAVNAEIESLFQQLIELQARKK